MDFYQRLRKQTQAWLPSAEGKAHPFAHWLMLVPDFFYLLVKLSLDKEVPLREKTKLAGAITYYMLPFDLFPEAMVGVAGYADDLIIAVYVIHGLVNGSHEAVVRRHWCGEEDVLTLTRRILSSADRVSGGGMLWHKLKQRLETGT